MEDIIILGAGISGLYLAIELLKKGRNVLIIEKSKRIGGRIHTLYYKDHIFESGAGRFSECHKNLFLLLKKYNLFDKKYPIEKYSKLVLVNSKKKFSDNIEDYYKLIFDKSNSYSDEYLAKKYTHEILLEIFGSKELVDHFITLYGYDGDILYSNAICGLNMLSCDYYSKQFYVLTLGLAELIKKMKDDFIQQGGRIQTDTNVENIYCSSIHNYVVESNKGDYSCKKLVLAIPPTAIEKLKPKNKAFNFLKYVRPVPLLRVYFYYDKPNENLVKLKKIITDIDIRFIIPINKNLIMISYSDSETAKNWNTMYNENKNKFYEKILKEFHTVTGMKLDIPDKTFMEYWGTGIYVWTPNYNYIKHYDDIINPLPNLYISNEGVSKKQGWIEGSLLIANDVLSKIVE
jgi:hypothetical protein